MATRSTNQIIPLEWCSFNVSTLAVGWNWLSGGYDYPVYLYRLTNNSPIDVYVSFDGETTHEFLKAGSIIELGAHPSENICWPERTEVWLAGTAAVQDSYVYLAAYTIKKDVER
jgi:hypothetical protein